MDAPLKELAKLEKLTGTNGKGPSIQDTLDSLLQSLHHAKDAVQTNNLGPDHFIALAQTIEGKKKEIDEKHREVYSATSRFGKTLDKVSKSRILKGAVALIQVICQRFPAELPSYSELFSSEDSVAALERTIALHFLRTGQFETAQAFLEVTFSG